MRGRQITDGCATSLVKMAQAPATFIGLLEQLHDMDTLTRSVWHLKVFWSQLVLLPRPPEPIPKEVWLRCADTTFDWWIDNRNKLRDSDPVGTPPLSSLPPLDSKLLKPHSGILPWLAYARLVTEAHREEAEPVPDTRPLLIECAAICRGWRSLGANQLETTRERLLWLSRQLAWVATSPDPAHMAIVLECEMVLHAMLVVPRALSRVPHCPWTPKRAQACALLCRQVRDWMHEQTEHATFFDIRAQFCRDAEATTVRPGAREKLARRQGTSLANISTQVVMKVMQSADQERLYGLISREGHIHDILRGTAGDRNLRDLLCLRILGFILQTRYGWEFERLRVRREKDVVNGALGVREIVLVQLVGEVGVYVGGKLYTAPSFEDVLAIFLAATRDGPLGLHFSDWYSYFARRHN